MGTSTPHPTPISAVTTTPNAAYPTLEVPIRKDLFKINRTTVTIQ